jgi:periplasmic protein TonB
MRANQAGRMVMALLASMAIHAGLLTSFERAGRGGVPVAPAARLQIDARLESPPPTVVPREPDPSAPSVNEPPLRQERAPRAHVPRPPRPAPALPPSPALVTPSADAAPARDPRVAGIEPQSQGRVAGSSDIESIDQYRLAMILVARRLQARTASAADRPAGVTGRVGVLLAIGANGGLRGARIARSSGHPALDEQALELMLRSRAETPLPLALAQREFEIVVTVVFEN